MTRTLTGTAQIAWGVSLGIEIKAARARSGLSRNELSRSAGCSPNHIQRIESGRCPNVGFLMLARLAALLSLNLEDLYAQFSKGEH